MGFKTPKEAPDNKCLVCWQGGFSEDEAEVILDEFKTCKKHENILTDVVILQKENEVKPPQKEFKNEDILVDEFINAEITNIEYEENHEFKGQFAKIGPAVRFTFALTGYNEPKRSRWLAFSYSEKANLYKVFVKPLVPMLQPFGDFDLDMLKGTKCKVMFSKTDKDGKTFYNIDAVRRIPPTTPPSKAVQETITDEDSPF